jgi:replicative DNA helicase
MSGVPALFGNAARCPPCNLAAEQSLLGGIMHNAKTLHDVIGLLRPEHFADPMHGRIFREQARRILDGGMGDAVSLKSWFEQDPDAQSLGGAAYLARLISAYVGTGTSLPYAQEIHDAWMRRELIAAGEDVVNLAFGRDMAPSEIIAAAVARIDGALGAETDRPSMSLDEAMDDALRAAEEATHRQGPAGLSTGLPSIDEHMGGLEDATLNVLAGRPGMGKSALGWQWAVAAARQGVGVLAISLEMSGRELGRRALAALSGVPVWAMKRGRMTNDQAMKLVVARKELSGLPVTIEDGGGLTAAVIDMKAREMRRRSGLGLIMVDHLHIVRPEDADVRQGATWAIGRISGAMKRMAKQHNCPVLLLAQLNRGVEGREDKRPALPDLRQAGDIEQDADVVSFVYRPEYYLRGPPERGEGETNEKHAARVQAWHEKKDEIAGKAELIFAKVRDGSPGSVPLTFTGDTTSFGEAAR